MLIVCILDTRNVQYESWSHPKCEWNVRLRMARDAERVPFASLSCLALFSSRASLWRPKAVPRRALDTQNTSKSTSKSTFGAFQSSKSSSKVQNLSPLEVPCAFQCLAAFTQGFHLARPRPKGSKQELPGIPMQGLSGSQSCPGPASPQDVLKLSFSEIQWQSVI